jgi:hypothetical protein
VLLNVLIVVVVDTYGAVKNDDSEKEFWTSRLEFVTEVVVLQRIFTTDANQRPPTHTFGQSTANVLGQPLKKTARQPTEKAAY